jgi:transcriptional regulator with XRE-family HTH domain
MGEKIGGTLRQARQAKGLTLFELSRESGVSPSFIGRVERGDRIASGKILRKLARPLGFEETTLLELAGFLSPKEERDGNKLDPQVAAILAQEPQSVQRAVMLLLLIIKGLAQAMAELKEG